VRPSDPGFAARALHTRDVALQMEGMRRLTHAFVDHPDTILQELVQAAVDLCGADSSGISVVREEPTDHDFYHWVATAGVYSGFRDAHLPRTPSACGICLERDRPQLVRVHQRFFDIMQVDAQTVTDGILLPWHVDSTRGTIWILAHGRHHAFDSEDLRMMQVLADFAAMAIRQQRQQKTLLDQASSSAAAAMANDLAHQINNPLQSLTNLVYLVNSPGQGEPPAVLASQLSTDLDRLTRLVKRLLELPGAAADAQPSSSVHLDPV
jgi:hypothetical protein